MTCFRSRDRWHSYVVKSLSRMEMREMETHLERCAECRARVAAIRETSGFLAVARVPLIAPPMIKDQVMAAIDMGKYRAKAGFPRFGQGLQHLGFSLLAAGIILLMVNLTPVGRNLRSGEVADLNVQFGKEIALPFTHLSQTLSVAAEKFGLMGRGQDEMGSWVPGKE
ncbi:Hypothetical protein DEACI_3352 [Acididesulfobacillus acetoxydans]|uniref:Zinc-finger domain-containing protein n=1 Tax=Acididesulfobacillus acetoxydans TaxID=1561005 RepID=A0A8S0VY66_9FIRM|nr:zf-HC2 domain-containing protein [Acididesulfobacillus acetoxydans]CAA7602673.1 Hypothetical protein DEACI_3352 [Acididesulfobacillus acetoxydans]CEJ09146.1 Hypothetical protein DEACI_3629 [Acididesulfobacillus acetoxydans]